MVAPPKQIISHKSVHWYQCISLCKMLGGEYYVHDKEKFCVKNPFFAKNALVSKKILKQNFIFGLIQAPNMSKHISRNRGATNKAS